MHRTIILVLISFASVVSLSVSADEAAGKTVFSNTCAACHGVQGMSTSDMFPNLAGQKKGYLINALKAYRDKVRSNSMMNGMVASFSDEQIQDVASYLSTLKP